MTTVTIRIGGKTGRFSDSFKELWITCSFTLALVPLVAIAKIKVIAGLRLMAGRLKNARLLSGVFKDWRARSGLVAMSFTTLPGRPMEGDVKR